MNKCIFLDRDGVINVDCVDYTYKVEEFKIIDGVIEALRRFKENGYLLIVITNQSGIAKGIYGHADVKLCHDYFQKEAGNLIDAFYYCPYHQSVSESLTRKPGTLMFERAIAQYNISIADSWMVGDRERDLIPAHKLGLKTVLVGDEVKPVKADARKNDLLEASEFILGKAYSNKP